MTDKVTSYGIVIENSSSFWDEVKLRAINNKQGSIRECVELAIDDVFTDIIVRVQSSRQKYKLIEEIKSNQV